MKLLLLSNSRAPDGSWLQWPRSWIREFLGRRIERVTFVPYAAVPGTVDSYDAYSERARAAFSEMGYALESIHDSGDPARTLRNAQAIVVGGGNTFQLLARIYAANLPVAIATQARRGVPYIGWSAGANLACPGIWTTNDMPIVAPPSLHALNLVPFQINPHFTDTLPDGHQGETRSERIAEFLELRPEIPVVGLREGALLQVENGSIRLHGTGARLFRAGSDPVDLLDGSELAI